MNEIKIGLNNSSMAKKLQRAESKSVSVLLPVLRLKTPDSAIVEKPHCLCASRHRGTHSSAQPNFRPQSSSVRVFRESADFAFPALLIDMAAAVTLAPVTAAKISNMTIDGRPIHHG